MSNLSIKEEEFLKHLKRKLLFKNITIRTKIPLIDLIKERKDVNYFFGENVGLLNDIIIDFILSKNDKVICGIEVVDEEDELINEKGRILLIDSLFKQMNYKYFQIVDLDKLKQAASIIAEKIQ